VRHSILPLAIVFLSSFSVAQSKPNAPKPSTAPLASATSDNAPN